MASNVLQMFRNKTPQQVRDDLDKLLLARAQEQLRPDTDSSDPRDSVNKRLQVILALIARRRYPDKFPFPDLVGGSVQTRKFLQFRGSVSREMDIPLFRDDKGQEIELPYWMKAIAKRDIVSHIKSLLSIETGNAYRFDEYTERFDSTTENDTTVNTSTQTIYVNGFLSDHGVEARISYLYVICDVYQVGSEKKIAADKIRRDSYARVRELEPQSTNVDTDEQLAQVLLEHAKTVFKTQFGFDYKETPKDRPRFKTIATITSHDQLCYIPNIESQNLNTFLARELFSGINLSDGKVKDKFVGDIAQQISYRATQQKGQWVLQSIDQQYETSDPSGAKLRAAGMVLFYHDRATSKNGIPVTGTYVYLLVMLYEIKPIKPAILEDIIQTLFDHLLGKITSYNGPRKVMDMELLKAALFQYGKQEFNRQFNFSYSGDDTKPPNALGGISGCTRFLDFEYPPSDQTVSERVGVELFQSDGFEFSNESVQKKIYQSLTADTRTFTQQSFTIDNQWACTSSPQLYPNEIKGYTTFIYALGSRSVEGVNVRRAFCYVIAVYCKVEADTGFPEAGLRNL